ncbi:unnamed protein product, partial [Staurois parvus]
IHHVVEHFLCVVVCCNTCPLQALQNTNEQHQGRTDNSWGPRAIRDHGAPVSLTTLKSHPKKPIKGTRGIFWGPLLTPGPWAVPKCSNCQSAPEQHACFQA